MDLKPQEKSARFPPPTTILKTIFSNYNIKEFSEIGNSRGHSLCSSPRCTLASLGQMNIRSKTRTLQRPRPNFCFAKTSLN